MYQNRQKLYGESVTFVPTVEIFTKNGAKFSDGFEQSFTHVIYATGIL